MALTRALQMEKRNILLFHKSELRKGVQMYLVRARDPGTGEAKKQKRIKRLRDMRNKHHDYCINSSVLATKFFCFSVHSFNRVEPEESIRKGDRMHVGKKIFLHNAC